MKDYKTQIAKSKERCRKLGLKRTDIQQENNKRCRFTKNIGQKQKYDYDCPSIHRRDNKIYQGQ